MIDFFESYKFVMDERFSKVSEWGPVWRFGRVIRNSMAHGGRIDIRDGTEVKWRKLKYSRLDQGRMIINIDMWPADIIVLIYEMEQCL